MNQSAEAYEPLARFLRRSKDFSREGGGTAKPRAFMPYRGATSVFRILRMTDAEVVELGELHVRAPDGQAPHGQARLLVSDIEQAQLSLNCDNTPERHAEIVGWPPDTDNAKQISIAQELAARARLILTR